jgi:DNA-binding CsgD family transcriptional regulator
MKYFILAYYVVTYSVGFVSSTLLYIVWHRSRVKAYSSLIFFILSFTVYTATDNFGFVLNAILRLGRYWSSIGFIAVSAAAYALFHCAVLYFTQSSARVKFNKALTSILYMAAFTPIVLLAFEFLAYARGSSSPESRLKLLELYDYASIAFLLYNTIVFFAHAEQAVDECFRKLMRFIRVLNCVCFPLFFLEVILNFYSSNLLRPITVANIYYLAGNIGAAYIVFKERFKDEEASRAHYQYQGDASLSRREMEIIELVAKGCSNKEIADRLFIEPATVKNHIYRIFKKTGARNRTQLVGIIEAQNAANREKANQAK